MTTPQSANDPEWGEAFIGFDGHPVYQPAPWVIDDDYYLNSGAVEDHFEAVGREAGARLVDAIVQSRATTELRSVEIASVLPRLRPLFGEHVNVDIARAYTEGLTDALTQFASGLRAAVSDRSAQELDSHDAGGYRTTAALSADARLELADQLDQLSGLVIEASGTEQLLALAREERDRVRSDESPVVVTPPRESTGALDGAGSRLRSLPMIELVPAMLDRNHPQFVELVGEAQRRWNASSDQRRLAWDAFGNVEKLDEISAAYDAAAVEEARQYLGMQTLIYELWVLQEAGVRPAELWADQDAPSRVFDVIRREFARADAHLGPGGEVLGDPDPLGDGARNLSRWVDVALFGDARALIEDQERLAGDMREDLLQQQFDLCSDAMAELRGPWSLPAFLASSPVGKTYYLPQVPPSPDSIAGLDVALGRPGELITMADIDAMRRGTDAAIAAEAERVASEDPFVRPDDVDPTRVPRERVVRMVAEMHRLEEFLCDALGLQRLAADRTVRVDGRPVARALVPWILGIHRDAAGGSPARFTSPITIGGLLITFTADPDLGTVAVIDAAGAVRRCPSDSLGEVLAILDQPDALTKVAKIRQGLQQLDNDLYSSARPIQPTVHPDALAERPGTAAAHHPTNTLREGRAR